MKRILTLALLIFACSLHAQQFTGEQVFLYTDKDDYVAGEELFLKLLVKADGFRTSSRSKVGYVELCDTQKPYRQISVALEEGEGNASFKIPEHIPSGVYQLAAYTRYMRNQGDVTFFTMPIAIINPERNTVHDPVNVSHEPLSELPANTETANITLRTDNTQYAHRQPVNLHLENLPESVDNLVISVYRNDSLIASFPTAEVNGQRNTPVRTPLQWLPEQEGHIITGKFPELPPGVAVPDSYLSFVGDDITIVRGKPASGNTTLFHTLGVFGVREIVFTTVPSHTPEAELLKMELESPFQTVLPTALPPLSVYLNTAALTERYLATQLTATILPDSIVPLDPEDSYFRLSRPDVYHLDDYTRFPTLAETFVEYLRKVRIRKFDDKRVLWTFLEEKRIFTAGPALVLLDGALISDHEKMIEYDPQYIQSIKVYDGRYLFGEEVFDGIIAFETYRKDLPFFQLSEGSHLFRYECPVKPSAFRMPDYSDPQRLASRKPDFRHTLYWNPAVVVPDGSSATTLTFYTSDLSGTFRVVARGFTASGASLYGESFFQVKSTSP